SETVPSGEAMVVASPVLTEVLMQLSSSSAAKLETSEPTDSVMRLVEMSAGYWLPRALHVVADLGVADKLDAEPRPAADLAKDIGVDANALDRLLRLLASHGVFERSDD